jgi:hypothetical protein
MEGKGCNFQGVSVGGRKRGEAEEVVVKVEERNEGGEGEMSAIVGTSDAQLEEERNRPPQLKHQTDYLERF